MRVMLLLVCTAIFSVSMAHENVLKRSETTRSTELGYYPNFSNNPALSLEMKRAMAPYLLPLGHPTKPILDKIFSTYNVVKNPRSLRKAGCTILHFQKNSFIVVLSHPELKGYLLKVYMNSEKKVSRGSPGWKRLTTRCVVAEKIKNIISRHDIRGFVVADKWLYPLPPAQRRKGTKQPVILIVKDMRIYSRPETMEAWRTKAVKRTLKELYAILGRGYGSAFLSGNLPYTKDKKFAFIDTEYERRPLPLTRLEHHFRSSLQGYWRHLVRHGSQKYVRKGPPPVGADLQYIAAGVQP